MNSLFTGKLRLAYEFNPIAFIAEQSGGKASNGFNRILDLKPDSLHQHCPFYVGSRRMVERLKEMML
jgi:fructose-1,6-bisphosphatase I